MIPAIKIRGVYKEDQNGRPIVENGEPVLKHVVLLQYSVGITIEPDEIPAFVNELAQFVDLRKAIGTPVPSEEETRGWWARLTGKKSK